MKILSAICMLCLITPAAFSQIRFWTDNFETLPSSGTRTTEENGGTTPTPSTAYFKLTDGSTVSQVVAFTGKQGTNYWAGEDHNAAGTGFTASGAQGAATNSVNNELQIEWTGINISGRSGLSFRGLLAANSTNEPWDNTVACISGVGTTNTDYIIVEYKIDAGVYTPLLRFFNRGSASGTGDKYLFEDTDNNGCGDGVQLTNVFSLFNRTIPATGTTMSLRIRVFCEGSNEEWGIDDFGLYNTSSLPVQLTAFTGEATGTGNRLHWTTTSETNSKLFEVEQSTDGLSFTQIGTVYSKGNSTLTQQYSFIDATAGAKQYYYRLKQVDLDGRFIYSNTILLQTIKPTDIRVYPAPATDKLTVQLLEANLPNSSIQLSDMSGRAVPISFSGSGIYRTAVLSKLASGSYVVKINTGTQVLSKIIIKR